MVTDEGIKTYFELFENDNNEANKEENKMTREMTREEKLWTMTGTTLLGVAEKLGIKTSKSILKQGKEKLIAKILEAENNWEKEADQEYAEKEEQQAKNDKVAEDNMNKKLKEKIEELKDDQLSEEETKEWVEKHIESKDVVAAPTKKRGALIEYNGKSQNICAWAKELGVSANTLYGRIYHMGWTVERAFTTPGRSASK